MRIVVTSDTHGKHDELPQLSGDVLIHCGDFCDGFKPDESDLKRIDDWFGRQRFRHVLCTGGNHDFVAQDRSSAQGPLFHNATYLVDSSVVIDGVRFYGAPWVPTLQRWAYYLSDDQLRSKWDLIPDDTDVLITHTPPWHLLDCPRDPTVHCGCSHLAARIAALNLKLHCFGHKHASYGRVDRDGVIFLNASAVNSDFDITNVPYVIDLDPDWGCAAVGRSGSVSIDVNETTTGASRWELDLKFDRFQLRFAIPSPDAVSEFHDFLAAGHPGELVIGVIASAPLTIIHDNEFDDRFFLMTSAADGALHWTLIGTTLNDLISALADTVSDLKN